MFVYFLFVLFTEISIVATLWVNPLPHFQHSLTSFYSYKILYSYLLQALQTFYELYLNSPISTVCLKILLWLCFCISTKYSTADVSALIKMYSSKILLLYSALKQSVFSYSPNVLCINWIYSEISKWFKWLFFLNFQASFEVFLFLSITCYIGKRSSV